MQSVFEAVQNSKTFVWQMFNNLQMEAREIIRITWTDGEFLIQTKVKTC